MPKTIHLMKNKVWIIVPGVVLVCVGCASLFDTADRESDQSDVITTKSQGEPGTALYYAMQVEKELGPLPHFSCDDCIEIPITQNGEPVTAEDLVRTEEGALSAEWCDKPAAFGDPCQVGNRVGRVFGTHADGSPRPEVVYVMFCRDGGMGVIGHNSETGATAFFSIKDGTEANGFVPGPRDPRYEQAWQSPAVVAADNCYKCHMADPFLHSPWIDQVRDPENPSKPLVPLIADETSPYYLIGDEFPRYTLQPEIDELVSNKCIECHGAQCVPDFFNVPLDELDMPAPFFEMHKETKMAEDREAIRKWCEMKKIRYFGK